MNATLRCTTCGNTPVVCVAPGDEPTLAPGGIVVNAGAPMTARCLACWPMARGVQRDLFGEARLV